MPDSSERTKPDLGFVLGGLAISAALIGVEVYLFATLWPSMPRRGWAIVLGGTIGYVLISAIVNVNPDHSDMGYFGGMMNNPFRISDDINRFLLWLQIMLMPGKLIAWSVASGLRLFLAGAPEKRRRR